MERYVDPTDIAVEVLGHRLGLNPEKTRAAFLPPQRLKEGLTNDSWLIRDVQGAGAWVIRFSNTRESELLINRESEAVILSAVAKAGIGPAVVACIPERHLLVTEYLPGTSWNPRAARDVDNLKRMVELLKRLHALPLPDGAASTDLRAVVTGYWNTLMARGLSARAGTLEQRDRARQIITEMQSEHDAVLCHNDIHHLNVIDSGSLQLIDWEYAGIGNPYFDLASICCYHAFSDKLRAQLLSLYLGAERPAELERLHRMCWLFDYIRDLWFAVREMK
jgi:thiamine kinase